MQNPYLYGIMDEDAELGLETVCYLDDAPNVVHGKEVFPEFVAANKLDVLSSGEAFMDVYDDLNERYPGFSKQQFADALNYYLDNDDYIDF